MEKESINWQELKDFVSIHRLQDRYSNIYFNAMISIETQFHSVNLPAKVRISFQEFDSVGKVSIIENELDPYLYPFVFDAKWQEMKHINKEHLKISGWHKQNPQIGKYVVKIFPI